MKCQQTETVQVHKALQMPPTVFTLLPADKQQKGSFYISDYNVQIVTNLRKDGKKNSCFELFAPGQRSFQVCEPTTTLCRLYMCSNVHRGSCPGDISL